MYSTLFKFALKCMVFPFMNKKVMALCCWAGIIMLWGWYEIFSRAEFYSQSGPGFCHRNSLMGGGRGVSPPSLLPLPGHFSRLLDPPVAGKAIWSALPSGRKFSEGKMAPLHSMALEDQSNVMRRFLATDLKSPFSLTPDLRLKSFCHAYFDHKGCLHSF